MKDKIIEEMARDIPSDIVTYNGKPKGLHLYIEQKQEIAKTLVKQGYCKIQKDSVMLSKTDFDALLPTNRVVLSIEEYKKYQRMENIIKRFSTISPTEAESENKALKEAIAIVLAQKRNIWKSYNEKCEQLKKARKETVKDIIWLKILVSVTQ